MLMEHFFKYVHLTAIIKGFQTIQTEVKFIGKQEPHGQHLDS